MKYGIKVGDLVKYKSSYVGPSKSRGKKMGLVLKMFKCSTGREIHVVWSNGAITMTSVHLLRKVIL